MAAQALVRTNLCVAGQGYISTSNTVTSRSGQSRPATPNVSESCTNTKRRRWFIPDTPTLIYGLGKLLDESVAQGCRGESTKEWTGIVPIVPFREVSTICRKLLKAILLALLYVRFQPASGRACLPG